MFIEFRQSMWPKTDVMEVMAVDGHIYVCPEGEGHECRINMGVMTGWTKFQVVGSPRKAIEIAIKSQEESIRLMGGVAEPPVITKWKADLGYLKNLLNYTGVMEYRESHVKHVVDNFEAKIN